MFHTLDFTNWCATEFSFLVPSFILIFQNGFGLVDEAAQLVDVKKDLCSVGTCNIALVN